MPAGNVKFKAEAKICPAGTYSAGGTNKCTVCPAGSYNTGTGNSSCDTCPKGYYCTGGSNKIACAANATSAEGSNSADDCKIYKCSIGTLENHATYGQICVTKAADNNWYNTVTSRCTTTAHGENCAKCGCAYTCQQDCDDDYAKTGYSESFGIAACKDACWIGGCLRCNSCSYSYTTTCSDTTYYCGTGWSTHSGSGSNLKCYKSATAE